MKKGFCSIEKVKDLKGKRVFLRGSLNVPLREDGTVLNDFRLFKGLSTIQFLQKQGARVIIAGHIGRDPKETLRPVFTHLKSHIHLSFASDVIGRSAQDAVGRMHDGDILLLENLRREEGEIADDFKFSESLSSLADIYVNDAFSVSHREHASIVGITKFLPSYTGLLFEEEFENLSEARDPAHPALFILGGAKFATKQPLIEHFLKKYTRVFVGGALSNDFYKAKGYEVGKSSVSEVPVNVTHLLGHERIIIPSDVTVLTKEGKHEIKKPDALLPTDVINDCGPDTIKELAKYIAQAKFILWNGPIGDYQKGFTTYTKELAELIVRSKARAIVGGGDTVSFIADNNLQSGFDFASTAGGAMLQFLLKGTLPGIEALRTCVK